MCLKKQIENMLTRKTTQYWDTVKNQYTKCLCYSKERGLYMDIIPEGKNYEELLFRPQGYIGKFVKKLDIPGKNIEITISSNFGYGNASYLQADINVDKRCVLDFDLSKLYLLNHCSVATLNAPIYDWNKLFEKIINGYNTASLGKLTTSAITYIEELSDMLDRDKIFVKSSMNDVKPVQWDGAFLVTLHAGRKLQDLTKSLETAMVSDSIVLKYTMNLCRKFIARVKILTLEYEDSRISKLSESLLYVHKFMCANNGATEYLNMILNKDVSH